MKSFMRPRVLPRLFVIKGRRLNRIASICTWYRVISVCILVPGIYAGFVCETKAQMKLAFVVGNADYRPFGTARHARENARLAARTLVDMGFDVRQGSNLTRRQFRAELKKFIRAARLADEFVFYYSGYAMTLDGISFLTPVNVTPTTIQQARLRQISLDTVLARLGRATTRGLVIIDANQKSPIAENFLNNLPVSTFETLSSGIAASEGILYPDTGSDVMLIKALNDRRTGAKPGDSVSAFTRFFFSYAGIEGMSVKTALGKVREELGYAEIDAERERDKTGSAETGIPVDNHSLKSENRTEVPVNESGIDTRGTSPNDEAGFDFHLAGQPLVVPEAGETDLISLKRWQSISNSNILEELQAFVESYPDSPMITVALQRLHRLRQKTPEMQETLRALTLERRALLKQVKEEQVKRQIRLDDLNSGPYKLEPLMSKVEIVSDVIVRTHPRSDETTYLSVLRKGKEAFVRGKLVGRNWYEIRWNDISGKRVKAYIHTKTGEVKKDSAYSMWQMISRYPSVENLESYLKNFPEGINRLSALRMLFALKLPGSAGLQLDLTASQGGEIANDKLLTELPSLKRKKTNRKKTIPDIQWKETDVRQEKRELIPEMGYHVMVFEEEYITKSKSNLRRLPWLKTRTIVTLEPDTKIVVSGKVEEANWYRVKLGEGRDLYVHSSLVEPLAGSAFQLWNEVRNSDQADDLEFFLSAFGTSRFAADARHRLQELYDRNKFETGIKLVVPDNQLLFPAAFDDNLSSFEGLNINVVPVSLNDKVSPALTGAVNRIMGRGLRGRLSSRSQPLPESDLNIEVLINNLRIEGQETSLFDLFAGLLREKENEQVSLDKNKFTVSRLSTAQEVSSTGERIDRGENQAIYKVTVFMQISCLMGKKCRDLGFTEEKNQILESLGTENLIPISVSQSTGIELALTSSLEKISINIFRRLKKSREEDDAYKIRH